VYFEIVDAWDHPVEHRPALGSFTGRAIVIFLLAVFITVMFGSALLAWKNLRLGRADRKGAFRLAVLMFAVVFLRWLLWGHHVATESEALNFIAGVRNALFWAGFLWVVYVAFEPFVRRRWPGRIISWNRLLAGIFRDPLVGRDILIGAICGVGVILFHHYFADLALALFGSPIPMPWFDFPATQLLGLRSFPNGILMAVFAALMVALILLFLWFLLYIILRRDLLAAIALVLLSGLGMSLVHTSLIAVPFTFIGAFLLVFVLYRYGVLSLISALFFSHLNVFVPLTSEFSAWYAADFVLALIISLGIAVFAFYTSLAGQPLFRGAIPDE
jgi:hypothetical protein